MGSYGIGVGRLLATVAEIYNDDNGPDVAGQHRPLPCQSGRPAAARQERPAPLDVAEKLYAELQAAGIEVLYDDREDASPGVKFNDADLIGLPLRITVGARSLEQGDVELKRRDQAERRIVPLARAARGAARRVGRAGSLSPPAKPTLSHEEPRLGAGVLFGDLMAGATVFLMLSGCERCL